MNNIKENLFYYLSLFLVILLFYYFEIWKFYPIYDESVGLGSYLHDWNYIKNYYECKFNSSLTLPAQFPSCVETLKAEFVYPKIWFKIYIYFKENFSYLIYIFILFYYFSSFYFFQNSSKIIHFFLLFSPQSILAIQRGNNELIIYFFIFIFLILFNYKNKILSLIPLIIAAFLKFYPLVLAPIYLFQNKDNKLKRILLFLPFLILGLFLFEDILKINKNIISNIVLTFSSQVLLKLLYFIVNFNYLILIYYSFAFLITIYILSKLFRLKLLFPSNYKYENSFLLSSFILVASFFLSSSYDYRLIFIIFSFPYIIEFLKKNFSKNNFKLIIFLICFSLWYEFIVFYYYNFINFAENRYYFGYVWNFSNIILGLLIIVKNVFYWVLNIFLIYLALNIVLKRIKLFSR